MKRLFTLIVCLTACLNLTAQTTERYPNTLLWEVSGNGLKQPSYLYGSMHIQDSRAFNFSDSVLTSLASCQTFALEFDPATALNELLEQMFNNDRETDTAFSWVDKLTPLEYKRLDEQIRAKTNLSLNVVKGKSPFIAKMLVNRGSVRDRKDMATFLDGHLFNIARKLQKETTGLETMSDYNNVDKNMSADDIREMLAEEMDEPENQKVNPQKKAYDLILEMYLAKDLNRIDSLMSARWKYSPKEGEVFARRNLVMLRSIEKIIGDGKTLFAVVGAAHLPGNIGLIKLLREKGYRVRPVSAVNTGKHKLFEIPKQPVPWATFTFPNSLSTVDVPYKPVSLAKAEITRGFDMQMSLDLGEGMIYVLFSLETPVNVDKDKEKIFTDIIENVKKEYPGAEKYAVKSCTLDGKYGKEMSAMIKKEGMIRMVVFLENGRLYYLASATESASKTVFDECSNRFFQSLKMKDVEVTSTGDIEFTAPQSAFAQRFPNRVQSNRLFDKVEQGKIITNLFQSTAKGGKTTYLTATYEYPLGMLFQNDTVIINSLVNIYTEEVKNPIISNESFENYPSRSFKGETKDGYVVGRMIMRGQRFYILIAEFASKADADADTYLSTFRFTPYLDLTAQWKPFTAADTTFRAILPARPQTEVEQIYGKGQDVEVYRSRDTSNWNAYEIYSYPISPYLHITTADSLLEWGMKEAFFNYGDSVLSRKPVTRAGAKGVQYKIQNPETHNRLWLECFASGDRLIMTALVAPDDAETTPSFKKFYENFSPTKKTLDPKLFGDKSDKILADLSGSDTTLANAAAAAFDAFGINADSLKGGLDPVANALEKEYKKKSGQAGYKTQLIFALFSKPKDPAVVGFAKRFYPYIDENDYYLENQLCSALIKNGSPEALDAFETLYMKDKKQTDLPWGIMQELGDSSQLLAAFWPRLKPYLQTGRFLNAAGIFATCLNDSLMTKAEAEAYLPEFKALYEKHLVKADKSDKPWVLYNYITVFGYFAERAEIEAILQKLSHSSDLEIAYEAATELLNAGKTVDPKQMEKFAADDSKRLDLYIKLTELDRLRDFPAKYAKTDLLMQSEAYNTLTEYGEYPTASMKLWGKQTRNHEGKTGVFYLYKYKFKEDKTTKVLLLGAFPNKSDALYPKVEIWRYNREADATKGSVNDRIEQMLKDEPRYD